LPVRFSANAVRGYGADSCYDNASLHLVRYADFMDADDVLLGLELGVIGGVLMLTWSALVCPLTGRSWWLVPNLFASHFYTAREVYDGPGVVTIVGIAVHIFTSGLVGVVNGVVTPAGDSAALAWRTLVSVLLPLRVEAHRAADAHAIGAAHLVDGLLRFRIHPRVAQARQGATRRPGRVIGTFTTSGAYFFISDSNCAAFPSSRNVSFPAP
jgi:hypothetical protein